jgi:hypothetical protein
MDRRTALRAAAGAVLGLAAYALVTLVVIGRPFASPDDFVLTPPGSVTYAVSTPSFAEVVDIARSRNHPDRGLLVLFPVALLGALAALRRDRPVAAVIVVTIFSAAIDGALTDGSRFAPLVMFALALGTAAALGAIVRGIALARERLVTTRARIWATVAVVSLALLATGGVRRAVASAGPLRFATERGVRESRVTLDHIECDFFAWENVSWECATFDGGGDTRVGLRTPERVHVAGTRDTFLLVPAARNRPHGTRRVTWSLPASDAFVLRVGAPNGPYDGVASLTLSIDGEPIDRFEVSPSSALVERRYDTSRFSGDVPVELEMRRVSGRSPAVAVDGGFE